MDFSADPLSPAWNKLFDAPEIFMGIPLDLLDQFLRELTSLIIPFVHKYMSFSLGLSLFQDPFLTFPEENLPILP